MGKKLQKSSRVREESKLDADVRAAVIAGLRYFASSSTLESLLYVLELEHGVDLLAVSENPKLLRTALSRMFGPAEYVVETKICHELGVRIDVQSEGKTLEDLVAIYRSRETG